MFLAAALHAAAAGISSAQDSRLQLLDVPYVPQSEALCGGAAAAMVMRYWGAIGVYAEDFSDLVDERAGGIRGDRLAAALQMRGWTALPIAGDRERLKSSLDARRPPIALIEDRPGRYHYVVVVGWHDGRVFLHDPARAPFQIFTEASFVRAWEKSGWWMLVALPERARLEAGAQPERRPAAAHAEVTPGGRCASLVEGAVGRAREGAVDDAQRALEDATARCPDDAAAWRELAGIHAVRKDWRRAAADARRALERDRADAHAARILGTSLYLEGDPLGALDAWNLVDEPNIDLVDVRGLERTRFAVAAAAMGLTPRTRLTSAGLGRAARRLESLPAVSGAHVTYTPGIDGTAHVTAAVLERPLLPTSATAIAATALTAVSERELRLTVASPSGGGEALQASWRWWNARPRAALGFRAPAPFGGTWGIEASAERETFGAPGDTLQQPRRRIALAVGDWATNALAWEAGLALERFPSGEHAEISGAIRFDLLRDRLTLRGAGSIWSSREAVWSGRAALAWRSRPRHERTVWLANAGVERASAAAAYLLWPGAGTGQGRKPLLRAHPLLHDGVIRRGVFGRGLVHASGEWRRWSHPLFGVVRVAPAVFVDAAGARHAPTFADSRPHVDAGLGARVALAGAGVLRVDLARGLRDGQMALSMGWVVDPW